MMRISELVSCGVDEDYIRACLANYQAGEITIAVTGEFSSGKSCFLNALAGRPCLLPEGDTECTPIYVELCAGPDDRLSVLARDGALRSEEFCNQTIERYARYSRDYAGDAMALHLRLEAFPLNERVHIVDCPGTNTVVKEHEQITGQVLKKSDAVIYAANKKLTETDLKRIEMIRRRNDRIIFILTHMDDASGMSDLPQEMVDKYMTEARRELARRLRIAENEIALYPIGSKRALEDGRMLAPIVEAINTFAGGLGEEEMRSCAEKKISQYLEGLMEQERQRIALLEAANAQDRTDLERRIAHANRALEDIRRRPPFASPSDGSRELRAFRDRLKRQADTYTKRVANKIRTGENFDIEAVSSLARQNAESFEREAEKALRSCISAMGKREFAAVAGELSALADAAELPMGELLQLTPPDFSDPDILSCARVQELQRQIDQCDGDIASLEDEIARNADDASAREIALARRRQNRDALRQELRDLGNYTPEYQMVSEEGLEEKGAKVGRVLGEVADIALLFWNPEGAAAKGLQFADKVKDTIKVSQYALSYASGRLDTKQKGKQKDGQKGKQKDEQNDSSLNKVAKILDRISLSGIGESIGEVVGGLIKPSRKIQVEDESVREKYFHDREELKRQIHELSKDIQNDEAAIRMLQSPEEKNRRVARLTEKRQMLEQKLSLQRQQEEAQARAMAHRKAQEQVINEINQYFIQRCQDYEEAMEPVFRQAGELLNRAAEEARQARIADAEKLLAQLGQEKESLLKEIRQHKATLDKLQEAKESVKGWLAAPEAC